jgi:hypothetical protein
MNIDNIFNHHPPTDEQIPCYQAIRGAAKGFALTILSNTPRGVDQDAALQKLRECVMFANSAIALDGKL